MSQTLSIPRQKLLEQLQAKLAENVEKRESALSEQRQKNMAIIDRVHEALLDNPQFVVWMVQVVRERWAVDPEIAEFAEKLSRTIETDQHQHHQEQDPDDGLKRLIAMYELASDTDITIEVAENGYRPLPFYEYLV